MEYYTLNTGDRIPLFGLGTWKSAPGEVAKAVTEALKLGYRHIDCAPIYGNEAEIGQALRDAYAEGTVRRDQIWLTSKLWNDNHAPEYVKPALDKTLADLQTDYLDLLLIHWPVAHKKGVAFPKSADDMISLEEMPISETWKAMEALVDDGLCRNIGVSNFSEVKLRSLLYTARIKPAVNQVELHPYLQQRELKEFCDEYGVHLTAYSPLGSPDRPAQFKAKGEPSLLDDPVLKAISVNHRVRPSYVLIRWAMQRGTSVIPKSVNPDRLWHNLAATELALTVEEMQQIAQLDKHRRYVTGGFWAVEGSSYTVSNLWDE